MKSIGIDLLAMVSCEEFFQWKFMEKNCVAFSLIVHENEEFVHSAKLLDRWWGTLILQWSIFRRQQFLYGSKLLLWVILFIIAAWSFHWSWCWPKRSSSSSTSQDLWHGTSTASATPSCRFYIQPVKNEKISFTVYYLFIDRYRNITWIINTSILFMDPNPANRSLLYFFYIIDSTTHDAVICFFFVRKIWRNTSNWFMR